MELQAGRNKNRHHRTRMERIKAYPGDGGKRRFGLRAARWRSFGARSAAVGRQWSEEWPALSSRERGFNDGRAWLISPLSHQEGVAKALSRGTCGSGPWTANLPERLGAGSRCKPRSHKSGRDRPQTLLRHPHQGRGASMARPRYPVPSPLVGEGQGEGERITGKRPFGAPQWPALTAVAGSGKCPSGGCPPCRYPPSGQDP